MDSICEENKQLLSTQISSIKADGMTIKCKRTPIEELRIAQLPKEIEGLDLQEVTAFTVSFVPKSGGDPQYSYVFVWAIGHGGIGYTLPILRDKVVSTRYMNKMKELATELELDPPYHWSQKETD